ncbi:hypothetical protein ND00_18630 [Clostridium sp. L74]|nr:hypothetical protein ND00_18630 [Clostridium sp. L74]
MDGNNIIISVTNDFYKEIIKEKHLEVFNSVYSFYKEHLSINGRCFYYSYEDLWNI